MLNKIKKKLDSVRIALTVGLASADKVILKDDVAKAPENTNVVSQTYSRHDFIRSMQQGKFTEQQLKMFYKLLDKFDKNHGRVDLMKTKDGYFDENGIWIEPEYHNLMITEEQHEAGKGLLGDPEQGYKNILFLTNKDIKIEDVDLFGQHEFDGSTGKQLDEAIKEHTKWEPTLVVYREYMTYGVPKIEDYANEIIIKIKIDQDFEKDKSCLIEFYCFDFNKKKAETDAKDGFFGEVNEKVFDNLQQAYTLDHFINFNCVDIKEVTATRNDIPHSFRIDKFKNIKKLDKGFVVKFYAEKISKPV